MLLKEIQKRFQTECFSLEERVSDFCLLLTYENKSAEILPICFGKENKRIMLNVLDITDNQPFFLSVYFAVIQPVNGTRCLFSLHLRRTSI